MQKQNISKERNTLSESEELRRIEFIKSIFLTRGTRKSISLLLENREVTGSELVKRGAKIDKMLHFIGLSYMRTEGTNTFYGLTKKGRVIGGKFFDLLEEIGKCLPEVDDANIERENNE